MTYLLGTVYEVIVVILFMNKRWCSNFSLFARKRTPVINGQLTGE